MEGGIGFAPMMRELRSRALVYLANHPKMARVKRFELLLNGLEPFVLPLHQTRILKNGVTAEN